MKTNVFEDILSQLDKAEVDALEELKRIRNAKAALKASADNPVQLALPQEKNNISVYDKSWSYQDKFLYILKKENKFIHFRQAAEIIIAIEEIDIDPRELTNKLSSATNALKKNGTIVKFQGSTSNTDTFWGSQKWLDDKGNIKPEHDFDKRYLTFNKSLKPLFEI